MTEPREPGDLEPAAGPQDAVDDRDEPAGEGHASAGPRRLARSLSLMLRYGAPVCAACALVLVMGDGDSQLDDDLQLFAPASIASDAASMPLRALHYARLRAPEGPVLVRDALALRVERGAALTARGERVAQPIARGRLEPARGSVPDLEANIPLPVQLTAGELLQVIAELPERDPPLEVRAQVRVLATQPSVLPEGRPLRGLQQYAAGPVHTEPGAIAPAALDVQVAGGACVPELPCRLLVHVGSPAAALRVLPNSTLTPAAASPSAETAGVVELTVTTHGPEAELWLSAERAGVRVARRNVRLPVAMAALDVQLAADSGTAPDPGSSLQLHSLAADGGCIADAFQDGQWRATGSLAACDKPAELPFALAPGLWRLQLRRDPFSVQTAGVAVIYRRAPHEAAGPAPAALLTAARRSAPDDALLRACSAAPAACQDAAAQRYLAALLETGLSQLPVAQTGYAASLARVREQRARMRTLALIALALGGTGLILSIGQSGVRAGQRISLLLVGDPGAVRRARLRSLLLVAASVASLVLVFSVLALYVVARGGY